MSQSSDHSPVWSAEAEALLVSPVRRALVDRLANQYASDESEWGLTAGDLADSVGLHVSTVRFHLDQLVEAGLVASADRHGGVGRPRKTYSFKPRMVSEAEPGEAFAALSQVLAEAWPAEGESSAVTPEEAGRRWVHAHQAPAEAGLAPSRTPGAWLGRVGLALDMLLRWGYTPEVRTLAEERGAEITLHQCPFLAVAAVRPDVVCGVHRGLLRGAMELAGEPDVEVTLRPFVGPDTCTAQIRQRKESS